MRYEDVKNLKAGEFRRLTGVKHETFVMMLDVLDEAEAKRKAAQRYRGGKKPKLTRADQLLMTSEYLREYRTQFHISKSYGLEETRCGRIIRHVEDTLMKSRKFTLPGRKALLESNIEYQVVVIDATETPIERPKKKQREFYSGKKKRHTLKQQVVVDKRTRKILCTAGSNGKKHDWKLLLESGVRFPKGVFALADSGYQGLQNISGSALIPFKGSKHNPLTNAQKSYNHSLSSERVFVENVIGWLKRSASSPKNITTDGSDSDSDSTSSQLFITLKWILK